jgi:hypothetical protein
MATDADAYGVRGEIAPPAKHPRKVSKSAEIAALQAAIAALRAAIAALRNQLMAPQPTLPPGHPASEKPLQM